MLQNTCCSNISFWRPRYCRIPSMYLSDQFKWLISHCHQQSDWRRPVGRPHSSWMATLKNDLSLHTLTFEDAIEMALDKPLWWLLAASGATHWWCMPDDDDDDYSVGQESLPIHLICTKRRKKTDRATFVSFAKYWQIHILLYCISYQKRWTP